MSNNQTLLKKTSLQIIPVRVCLNGTIWAAPSEFVTYRLCIRAVSPEPPLLAHTSSESRGTFRQKARSLAPLNGWACAVEICHDGMLEDTNSLDAAHLYYERNREQYQQPIITPWRIAWRNWAPSKEIWYLSPMRAAKVQASLRIRVVSPEPSLLVHTSSESRGTFRQKARSLAPLNGWACAVKICQDGMLEDTNSLDGAQLMIVLHSNSLHVAASHVVLTEELSI